MTLSSLQNAQQLYTLAGFQDSRRLAELFGLDLDEPQTWDRLSQLVELFGQAMLSETSGVVLDPRTGLSLLGTKPKETGVSLLLTEEIPFTPDKGSADLLQIPKLLPKWGVEHTKHNYAVAYLPLFYHPQEEQALDKKQFLAEIYDFCDYEDIELFLDLRLFSLTGEQLSTEEYEVQLLEAIQELRATCHLMGLVYPGNPLIAATVTSELDIPWVVSSATESYDEFKNRVREALDSGAKGFFITDTLFKEVGQHRSEDLAADMDQIKEFLQTTARDRLIELSRIVNETSV
jgi:tagatose-1,6-bisphosphate aldolase